jgi:hypothetical protein
MKLNLLMASAAMALVSLLPACTSPAASTETTAKPVSIQNSCINPTRIREQKVVSDQEIQFTLAGGEVWTNRLTRACSGLKSQGGFSWDVSGTLVCSNTQTIYVLDWGTPCQLGEFTHMPPAPKL